MRKFLKDCILFFFAKNQKDNKVSLMMDSIFKDFPAFFWKDPSFKKGLIAPLLFIYHLFSKGEKKEKDEKSDSHLDNQPGLTNQ